MRLQHGQKVKNDLTSKWFHILCIVYFGLWTYNTAHIFCVCVCVQIRTLWCARACYPRYPQRAEVSFVPFGPSPRPLSVGWRSPAGPVFDWLHPDSFISNGPVCCSVMDTNTPQTPQALTGTAPEETSDNRMPKQLGHDVYMFKNTFYITFTISYNMLRVKLTHTIEIHSRQSNNQSKQE